MRIDLQCQLCKVGTESVLTFERLSVRLCAGVARFSLRSRRVCLACFTAGGSVRVGLFCNMRNVSREFMSH